MTNQHDPLNDDDNPNDESEIMNPSDQIKNNAPTKKPQSIPVVAPETLSNITGATSRYDSDYDDECCVSLLCVDESSSDDETEFLTNEIASEVVVIPPAISIRPSSTLYLPNLPMDTLHRWSRFLTARELVNVGMTSKRMGERIGEVWRRVRGHAGRCLGEVMLAWSMGEHADARELAALYLRSGVPIYPAPHGHAYHTIAWRMGLEAKDMMLSHHRDSDEETTTDDGETNDTANRDSGGSTYNSALLDPFYSSHFVPGEVGGGGTTDRHSSRPVHPLTFVEEKSLFWKEKRGIPTEQQRRSVVATASASRRPSSARGRRSTLDGGGAATAIRRALLRDHRDDGGANHRPPVRRSSFSDSSHVLLRRVPSPAENNATGFGDEGGNSSSHKKMNLKIHRHLADQHLFDLPSVREEGGNMVVGPVNLNADFFHPHIENSLRQRQHAQVPLIRRRNYEWMGGESMMDETLRREGVESDFDGLFLGEVLPFGNAGLDASDVASDGMVDWDLAGDLGLMQNPYRAAARAIGDAARSTIYDNPWSLLPYASPASDVQLQMYSLSSPNLKSDNDDSATNETLSKVRARFAYHQHKLESCLSSVQDFDNCLLDWWDEIFPISAGIHFYNRQSPVPRMTHLHSFLNAPCPKALGVVQCEIERVKISSKKKLFPTYEYRLFIRDVKNDNPHNSSRMPPRKDSVLLVAKSKVRPRKGSNSVHPSGSGSGASPGNEAASKRGVTNYYMCLPQQRDVDLHFKSANKTLEMPPGETSGLAVAPLAATSTIVGRVQGNFIGTEFQIFGPPGNNMSGGDNGKISNPLLLSDDGRDGESPTVPAARRRSSVDGLVRLARRASLTMSRRPSVTSRRLSMTRRSSTDNLDGNDEQRNRGSRRKSWTDNLPGARKTTRTKKSSVANSEIEGLSTREYAVVEEEECGAITYTANLLGNRPRIMDVCVPKIMEDGTRCLGWKSATNVEVDDGEAGTNSRMLNQFKAIQQQREQAEADAQEGREETTPAIDDHGLMILQNRPPWWNVEIGAFVLNFGGRVSVASVKNFQLCERTNQDQIMLQFGRIQGRHSFTMDFQYPLSPMQAFAIAISSLQSKISFG